MKRILFSLTLVICLMIISPICFAENTVMNDMKNATENMINGVEGITQGIGNGIKNTAEDAGSEMQKSGEKILNATNDMMSNNNMMIETTPNNYNTTKTSNTFSSDNTMYWIWAIIIFASIVIIGAIWYYSTQNKDEKNRY